MASSSPFSSFESEDENHNDTRSWRPLVAMRYIIPNIVTVLALCAGISSIRLAFEQRFEYAVIMVLVAACLDGLDGRIARVLDGASPFGAQMDSLADVINFGLAPALIAYAYSLNQVHQLGWIAVLIYCTACCLRLARFNVMLEDKKVSLWQKNYFIGVPAPAGALLLLFPTYIGFLGVESNEQWALFFSCYTVIIAVLLVSKLPVWNGKKIGRKLPRDLVIPLFLLVAAYVGFVVAYIWQTLAVTALLYIAFLPLSAYSYKKKSLRAAQALKTVRPKKASKKNVDS